MPILIFVSIISGFFLGLAANYLADVLPRNRKLTKPVCLTCGEYRNIKDFLTGKDCRFCGKKNALRFWLVIIGSIILSLLSVIFPIGQLPFWASEAMLLVFITMTITDLEYRVILEQVSGVGYVVASLCGYMLNGLTKTILGGISGFFIFLLLYYFGKVFARKLSRNREQPVDEEALGFGDVNLAGIVGLLTGFPYVLPALLLAIVFGGVVSGGYILFALFRKRYQAFQAIPYGPFIIAGSIFILNFYH